MYSIGSVLAGYAIDINGDLVEGVVIEKEKARQVFETEARKEVSHKPTASIAEHVVGNVFKTRVFPIPKRAPRTIRVTTVEELGADGAFYLLLDFAGKSIENYNFNVQVDCHDGTVPRLWDGLSSSPRSGRTMAALEFSKPEKKNKLKSSSASVNTSGQGRELKLLLRIFELQAVTTGLGAHFGGASDAMRLLSRNTTEESARVGTSRTGPLCWPRPRHARGSVRRMATRPATSPCVWALLAPSLSSVLATLRECQKLLFGLII